MKDYYFIAGQIRAMESRLLNVNRLDRMIGAVTPETAFRVMVEMQYAEYFDDSTMPEDFVRIIDQGLSETKTLLVNGTHNAKELQALWLRFDFNNIKRALKEALLEGKEGIKTWTEEAGYSLLGEHDQATIQTLVWGSGNYESCLQTVVNEAKNLFATTQNFQQVEFLLDNALMQMSFAVAKATKSAFLKKILMYQVDSANLRTVVRCVAIAKKSMTSEMYIEGGTLEKADLIKINSVDTLKAYFGRTQFWSIVQNMSDKDSLATLVMDLERKLEQAYQQYLTAEDQGAVSTIQIPFVYFERRTQNARLLKFIMYAKFHGVPAEKIYETLKHY